MPIDEDIDQIIREETPQAKATSSLIDVKPRKKGEFSNIELKTDLTEADVCLHTRAEMLQRIMESSDMKMPFLSTLVEIKERKLLSKDRKSRLEIVEIGKQPDQSLMNIHDNSGSARKFFFGGNK